MGDASPASPPSGVKSGEARALAGLLDYLDFIIARHIDESENRLLTAE